MVVPCAVVGCEDKTSPRHRFPDPDRDRNRYNTWVSLTCNMKLMNMDPKRVYANYRICHRHFAERNIVGNKLLKRTTVPSKELPNYTGMFLNIGGISIPIL